MRARQPRRRVYVAARLRCGTAWTDICIRNMSSRGLMAETELPPPPRSIVEIRRGTQIIIGRVIWSQGDRFGLRTQDDIDIDAVVSEPRLTARPAAAADATGLTERRHDPERRRAEHVAASLERSRRRSAALQFLLVAAVAGIAAVVLAGEVYALLSAPLKTVAAQLCGPDCTTVR